MSTVTLQSFGQPIPNQLSGGGSSGSSGTSFTVTLDSNGKQTLDVTTLGLSSTTGKQVSGLIGKYDSDLFFTAGLYWEIVNSTTLRFWSSAESVHDGLVLTGLITDEA